MASTRARALRGWCALALAALVSLPGLVVDAPEARSGTRYHFKGAERCFMRKINRHRHRRGLRRLDRDRQLGYVARRHARRMARNRGGIWHDGAIGRRVTRWRALGQNTGRGRRCRSLFRAFWASPLHRANILGPWRHMGVGTKRRDGGRLYVQQVFESKRNPGNVYRIP